MCYICLFCLILKFIKLSFHSFSVYEMATTASPPPVENVGAGDDASYSSEELGNLRNNLSDADKCSLCNGDYFISSNSDITSKVFGVLYSIAENFSSNTNKALEQILPCLNE